METPPRTWALTSSKPRWSASSSSLVYPPWLAPIIHSRDSASGDHKRRSSQPSRKPARKPLNEDRRIPSRIALKEKAKMSPSREWPPPQTGGTPCQHRNQFDVHVRKWRRDNFYRERVQGEGFRSKKIRDTALVREVLRCVRFLDKKSCRCIGIEATWASYRPTAWLHSALLHQNFERSGGVFRARFNLV